MAAEEPVRALTVGGAGRKRAASTNQIRATFELSITIIANEQLFAVSSGLGEHLHNNSIVPISIGSVAPSAPPPRSPN